MSTDAIWPDEEAAFAEQKLLDYLPGGHSWTATKLMRQYGTRSLVYLTNRLPEADRLRPEDRRGRIAEIWPLESFERGVNGDRRAPETEPYQGESRERAVDIETGEITETDVFGGLER
jgi:hypothetical protein